MDTTSHTPEYIDGFHEALDRQSRDSNPYILGSREFDRWDLGWIRGRNATTVRLSGRQSKLPRKRDL